MSLVKSSSRERIPSQEMQRTTAVPSTKAPIKREVLGRGWCSDADQETLVHRGVNDPVKQGRRRPVLCCSALCCINPWAAGQTPPAPCNRGTYRQLPLAPGEKDTCEQDVHRGTSFTVTVEMMSKIAVWQERPVILGMAEAEALFLFHDRALHGMLCVLESCVKLLCSGSSTSEGT